VKQARIANIQLFNCRILSVNILSICKYVADLTTFYADLVYCKLWLKLLHIFVLIRRNFSSPTVGNRRRINADVDQFPPFAEKETQLTEEVGATLHLLDSLGGVGHNVIVRRDSDHMIGEQRWVSVNRNVEKQLHAVYYKITKLTI